MGGEHTPWLPPQPWLAGTPQAGLENKLKLTSKFATSEWGKGKGHKNFSHPTSSSGCGGRGEDASSVM